MSVLFNYLKKNFTDKLFHILPDAGNQKKRVSPSKIIMSYACHSVMPFANLVLLRLQSYWGKYWWTCRYRLQHFYMLLQAEPKKIILSLLCFRSISPICVLLLTEAAAFVMSPSACLHSNILLCLFICLGRLRVIWNHYFCLRRICRLHKKEWIYPYVVLGYWHFGNVNFENSAFGLEFRFVWDYPFLTCYPCHFSVSPLAWSTCRLLHVIKASN